VTLDLKGWPFTNFIFKCLHIIYSYCESTFIRWHHFSWFPQNVLIIDSWIRGFKCCRQQSMGKLYFVGFCFSWFKWTTKYTKMRTSRLIMISQYLIQYLNSDGINNETFKQIYDIPLNHQNFQCIYSCKSHLIIEVYTDYA